MIDLRSRVALCALALAPLLAAAPAAAQPAPAPPAGAAPPTGAGRPTTTGSAPAPGTPAAAPGTTTAALGAPGATPLPPRLTIDDPMLADVAAPARVLATWRDAVRLVSTRDVEYAIALAEIERAEGVRRQALAAALPTVSASGAVTVQLIRNEITSVDFATGAPTTQTVPASPTAQAQITARHPILAPRAWHGIGTADAQIDVAKLSVEDRRRILVAAAADAVVGVVTSERVAEINRVGLHAAMERLQLTRRRQELGSGTMLDVVRFDQDVAIARATLIQGDESLRRARESLGVSLGETEPYGVPRGFTLDGLEADARAICQPTSLQDRADLRAARATIELAERGVTDADLLYLPTAEISTTATLSSEELATTDHFAWNVQALLTIPIWDGGARYGAHRAAVAEVDQARQRAMGLTRVARVESAQARRGIEVANQALVVARTSRDLAREVERLSQRAWEAGAGTSFDLVDAGRRVREAELQLAVREFELIRSQIAALLVASSCKY